MFSDLRDFDDDAEIVTDVCVVGAGAAGITIAREFIGKRVKVCLVESGGLEFDEETQNLYKGSEVGIPYDEYLDTRRLRMFGGSTNHWGGRCTPFNEIDFEKRPWVPYSGWPIKKSDLDPYYARAQDVLGLGPYRYEPDYWQDETYQFLDLMPDKLVTRVWQQSWPPMAFGEAYQEVLEEADNVLVLLHTNAIEIDTYETATEASGVRLATLDGKRGYVRAKVVILACGGIESARLLLASNRIEQAGLGNRFDLVGRFFMEHPNGPFSELRTIGDVDWLNAYRSETKSGTPLRAALAVSEAAQRREHILNCSVHILPDRDQSAGYLAFRRIVKPVLRGELPDDFGTDVWNVITDLDDVASGVYSYLANTQYRPPLREEQQIALVTIAEQAPNPDSRLKLTAERDSLGMPKLELDWRLAEIDKRTIRVTNEFVAQEFGRMGRGRVKIDDWLLDDRPWSPELNADIVGHQLGTTRMSDDPKKGVVDPDCRVHGMANLYIASSSVFPTGSYANPTLTIVALSIRVADAVKSHVGVR